MQAFRRVSTPGGAKQEASSYSRLGLDDTDILMRVETLVSVKILEKWRGASVEDTAAVITKKRDGLKMRACLAKRGNEREKMQRSEFPD